MALQNQTFVEGISINRSLLFYEENYLFWKVRMKIFLKSVDRWIWDAVINGLFVSMHMVNNRYKEKDVSL